MIDIDRIIGDAENAIENGDSLTIKTKTTTLALEPTEEMTFIVEIESISKKGQKNRDLISYLDDLNEAEIDITDLEEILSDIETFEQEL